jgi:UDP-glucose 4-epimerase
MRILVTRGAGYIGSATVRRLRARGHEPIELEAVERGQAAAIEAVIHLAALKSDEESLREPAAVLLHQRWGTMALADAMPAAGVCHLVYSSSCAVYGTPESPSMSMSRGHPRPLPWTIS